MMSFLLVLSLNLALDVLDLDLDDLLLLLLPPPLFSCSPRPNTICVPFIKP